MISVLIVDDSAVTRRLLAHLLELDPGITVIGQAATGEEALSFLKRNKPDVITMDLVMPGMSGIEATRAIMETHPTPIVIVTANWTPAQVEKTFQAVEIGAVAIIEKPRGPGHPDADRMTREMIATLKAMANVPVVRRWKRESDSSGSVGPNAAAQSHLRATGGDADTIRGRAKESYPQTGTNDPVSGHAMPLLLVAVGASTGGPLAVQALLSRLPDGYAVPIVVVQHIAPGFAEGMADWLSKTTRFRVTMASEGTEPRQGGVYLAPDGSHMEVGIDGRLALSHDPPIHGVRPAVANLFRSMAAHIGRRGAGVLLTGMGTDGAVELKAMRRAGAITFAQDAASSVVFGMPGEAIRINAAEYIMPPEEIADTLARLA